jgi:hypothetical protein
VAPDGAREGTCQNEIRAPIQSLTPAGGRVRLRVGPLTAEIANALSETLALEPSMVVRARFEPAATRLIARGRRPRQIPG